jgi:hypothetical protein
MLTDEGMLLCHDIWHVKGWKSGELQRTTSASDSNIDEDVIAFPLYFTL